jgi:hypothetical protein
MQPGVYGNAPRTPNPYDRHCVNEKSITLAAWKHCWFLAKALKLKAEECGLGGSVGTQQVLAHQHMREWDKSNDKWHAHHRIQQEWAKTKPRLHIEHPPKAVEFATGRFLLAPRDLSSSRRSLAQRTCENRSLYIYIYIR